MAVDLVLLSRDMTAPRSDVWQGVASQTGVGLRVHRVTGPPRPGDANRWETIARARNAAKRQGSSPWVFLLDDDVVLAPDCVARLVERLERRPVFAALAADYNGEMASGLANWDYPPHVGMGAVLFRREALERLTFRWEPGRCECLCCCADLRRAGRAIGYLPGARAWHRPEAGRPADAPAPRESAPAAVSATPVLPGRVLTAFDRAHYRRFRSHFLPTLRASGNGEVLTAVVYGLRSSECGALAALPGVEVVTRPGGGPSPAAQRLRDFPEVVARWPADTPVAYWDAGDVLFQSHLGPLWDLVRSDPDRLLVAREPVTFTENGAVSHWVKTVRDPGSRRRLLDLFSARPLLNAGFAAGTARALLRGLVAVTEHRDSPTLRGSTDWGDQTAMNLYCHTHPDAWCEAPEGWNFCLHGRRHVRWRPDGTAESLEGIPVHVVHGNGGSLGVRALAHYAPGIVSH
jgi:hypothetical protein